MTWDGDLFWGTALDFTPSGGRTSRFSTLFYTSSDRGQTWTPVRGPMHSVGATLSPTVHSIGHKQTFAHQGLTDGHLRDQDVWTRIQGSGALGREPIVAIDQTTGDVYFSGGRGVFRLEARFRSISPTPSQTDSDGDGISDSLDRFPNDRLEYLDTDGDGLGNSADTDDDGDGISDAQDEVPLDHRDHLDTDADGLGNRTDVDDDGDGVEDWFDAFPLDRKRSLDADRDGTDDWSDDDDDNDGVPDMSDAFPEYPGESNDTDGDGIGDNLDWDDDNDGRNDPYDADPKFAMPPLPSLRLDTRGSGIEQVAPLLSEPLSGIVYPDGEERPRHFGEISLGSATVPFMIEQLSLGSYRVYVDRDVNQDLTNDGPPTLVRALDNFAHYVHLEYPYGITVPYRIAMRVDDNVPALRWRPGTSWRGEVKTPGGLRLPVIVQDNDGDGLYTGTEDHVCVLAANCAWRWQHGRRFSINGYPLQVLVAGSGHHVEIAPPGHSVPYVPEASHPDWQGFVRMTDRGSEGGAVQIHAFDDSGTEYGPVELQVPAGSTKHINSNDLENGNAAKGLAAGVGNGDGGWQLRLYSDLDLDVLGYMRTTDGFLTSMHDVAVADERRGLIVSRVPILNPGRNRNQESLLRLINPGSREANVSIQAIDDDGSSTSAVSLTLPPRGAHFVTARELETGDGDLEGAPGEGSGKWRLEVTSGTRGSPGMPVRAMSLLRSPGGHLTNLSTPPYEDGGPLHHVALFSSADDPVRQGFVRIINHSSSDGAATIVAYDDEGFRYGPITLELDSGTSVHFNSDDLEAGNPSKGLTEGVGRGSGAWRLEIESDLDIDVLGYLRTMDGFLTSIHDVFHRGEGGVYVPTFNPGSNRNQVSQLRLINPSGDHRQVSLIGVDDAGNSPGATVLLTIPPYATRTYTSQGLESGLGVGLNGGIGDGTGKWRLELSTDGPLRVMSLLESPTGHLTNLSTMPVRFPSRKLESMNTGLEAVSEPTSWLHHDASLFDAHETDTIEVDSERLGILHIDRSLLTGDL